MNKAVIGLGSNIDARANIARARKLLKQRFSVIGESAFVRTKPVGYLKQDDFINGSVYIETAQSRPLLKRQLKTMEKELGRRASRIKSGPRTIDMDIVVFNGRIVDKDFYKREFLKNAVLELLPGLEF
jgi:2-amino-4-hydroxy-6-hydroxymethyldihydropteridine diphosphokinase